MQIDRNLKSGDGNRNELRGMWYPAEYFARIEIPFDVTEVNFQNRGLYPAIIGIGKKGTVFGEEQSFYQELEIQPREIIRDYVLPEPVRHFWIRSHQRITRIYFLVKGA